MYKLIIKCFLSNLVYMASSVNLNNGLQEADTVIFSIVQMRRLRPGDFKQ